MQFEKLDIINLVAVCGLVAALMAAIFFNRAELSTTISAGLLGYIGGIAKVSNLPKAGKKEDKNVSDDIK